MHISSLQGKLVASKASLDCATQRAKAKLGELKLEVEAKIKSLEEQTAKAQGDAKFRLEARMEQVRGAFQTTDVALVIGANDVVNPAARIDKASPIFGMPILNADKAKKVFVVKRGDGKGYAGIVNALFYGDNCDMVYGDAQAVLIKVIEAVRGLGLPAAA
jgi:NAD(P) transhydrogenase subunit beta